MELIKKGRVKDVYKIDAKTQVIVSTDRIAFDDLVLKTVIPEKGIITNKLLEFWLNYTKKIVPNNLKTTRNKKMPGEFQTEEFINRCMMVEKVDVLPVHAVVRGYLAGSGWESYHVSGSVGEVNLPRGLAKNEALPEPIYTPKMRLKNKHSISISFADTVGMIGSETAEEIRDISSKIYSVAAEYALSKGLIIADTKLKFGITATGKLVLLDGLTPDNSRIWKTLDYAISYGAESLDKHWLADSAKQQTESTINITYAKYYDVFRMLTGKTIIE